MKITTYFLLVASLVYLSACSEDKTQNAAGPETKENVMSGPSISSPSINTNEGQSSGTSSQAGSPAAGAQGINPAHGAPGHDCALPVGAPLGSAPANPNAPQVELGPQPGAQGAPTAIAPAPAPQPTAAGMNPAHGQPGHDCAIAVGAPLKK